MSENVDKKILWGSSAQTPTEIIQRGDQLNVNPSWFSGIRQTDGYSCCFFVLTALDRMQRDPNLFNGGPLPGDEVQQSVVNATGLDNLRTFIQKGRTEQLTNLEFQTILRDLASQEAQVFTSRTDLPFSYEGMTSGQVAVQAVNRGYGVAIELQNLGHLVFAIGTSQDETTLICWDPLNGQPDNNYPTSLLKRVPADSEHVSMWGGMLLSDRFKQPKSSMSRSPQNLIRFGEEKDMDLLQKIAAFFNSIT